jgi:PAS domain S-box-containing protein
MTLLDRYAKKSFKTQIIVGAILIQLFVISIFTFDFILKQKENLNEHLIEEASYFATTIASASTSGVLTNDMAGLLEIIQRMKNYEEIEYIFIHSPDGKVISHIDQSLIGKYIADQASLFYLKSNISFNQIVKNSSNAIDVVAPIRNKDTNLAYVRIALSKEKENVILNTTIVKAIFYAFLGLVISSIFFSWIMKRISNDLEKLIILANFIQGGERKLRADENDYNELGKLGRIINSMLDNVQKSEERLELAFKGSRDGLWDWNIKTNETYHSSRWLEMLGYEQKPDYQNFHMWRDSVHPDDLKKAQDAIQDHIDGKKPTYECEHRLKHKDGHYIWTIGRGIGIRDENGIMYRIVGTQTDITAQKNAELEKEKIYQQLQQSQKMEAIGQLTGGIAHDFNNILAGIIGFNDLALKKVKGSTDDKLLGYLAHISKLSLRARELVKQMLIFSRGGDPKPVVVNIKNAIDESMNLIHPLINKEIELNFRSIQTDESLFIKMDPTQLQQITMNLIINARDSIEKYPGNISINLGTTSEKYTYHCKSCGELFFGKFAFLKVTDSGKGMSDEIKKRIFEPFYTTKDPGKGTGMGLSMVHGIVHRHGGHLIVDSKVDIGTEFSIFFPLIENQEAIADRPESIVINNKEVRRVLIVDDEDFVREFVRDFLEEYHFECVEAVDGEDALSKLKTDPHGFDLILTDYTMPKMNGLKMIEHLRKDFPYLPVILTSGNIDVALDKEYRHLNINGVLVKPYEVEEALRLINNVLLTSKRLKVA